MTDEYELLTRIESGEVSYNEVSTSEQIMAALTFEKSDWLPERWASGTEQQLIARINVGQIKAIKQSKI
ncbi:hypothetical protein [Pseudoalteromonas prydzensis]|uniref:hypothetical protein n=1 Tax=Pseudoalteromonas prydzensis TaxID=182141 RepID=UPI003FD3B8EA